MLISPTFVLALAGVDILFKLYTSDEILFSSSFFKGKTVLSILSNLILGLSIDFSTEMFLEK